jgi:CRP/FNR family transcriptional regulator
LIRVKHGSARDGIMLAKELPMSKSSRSATPENCDACNVRHAGMCAVLSATELSLLAASARRTQHEPGDTLILEDSRLTSYANVTEGIVKLSRVLRSGKQQVVGLQFAPDLLGRLFGTGNAVTVEAASDVDICRVPKEVLEGLISSSPDLKRRLLEQSLQDLDEAREWMVTLGRKDAQQKVASLILMLARRNGTAEGRSGSAIVFDLPLSRTDMADFLGITVETVSRQVSVLRKDGVIRVENHRRVAVPDLARLQGRAG